MAEEIKNDGTATAPAPVVKRPRGRPKGSKNKPKVQPQLIVPTGPVSIGIDASPVAPAPAVA